MSFSPDQLAYADILLELQIRRADGQAYEDLFVRVMTRRHPEFRPVKPQGKHGDKRNDGYCASKGVYYQVYAPENHSAKDMVATVEKIETDFDGLKSYWGKDAPVQEYHFVINDKLKGTYPAVETALLKIKSKHSLSHCAPFLAKDLMRVFSELSERDVIAIVGHIPADDDISDLDYSIFTDVLSHIIKDSQAITPDAVLRVPDFSEKIQLNRISPNVARLLETGNLQSGAVEAFFNSHGTFSKTAIRDKLAEVYGELRDTIGREIGSNVHRGDMIFFGLLDLITPQPPQKPAKDAAVVPLSYFFETCDIYEDPNLV